MNKFSQNKIKELNAIPLIESKEWQKHSFKKLIGREVYWTWKQQMYEIKYICPMTLRVWFTKCFNGWKNDTNAISEMYLLPLKTE